MKHLLQQCAEWLSVHSDDENSRDLLERICAKLKSEEEFFIVSVVSRDDLISQGYDGNAVDDKTMERIASSMGKGSYGIR